MLMPPCLTDQAPPDEGSEPDEEASARPEASNTPSASPLPAGIIYLLVAAISFAAIFLSQNDIWLAVAASCLTTVTYWMAFLRLNPRGIGLELIIILVATYYWLTKDAVLWMTASALAGGVGAWLTNQRANEDDFLFLPAGAALISFAILLWLGMGGQLEEPIGRAQELIESWRAEVELEFERASKESTDAYLVREYWELIGPVFPQWSVGVVIGAWTVALWFSGRMIRALLGRMNYPFGRFIFFRIHHRYVFLLIASLILVILGFKFQRGACWTIAAPIFVVLYLATYFAGLAVILFHGTLWRKQGRRVGSLWCKVIGVGVLIVFPYAGALIGLADVWFDFRRIDPTRREGLKKAS